MSNKNQTGDSPPSPAAVPLTAAAPPPTHQKNSTWDAFMWSSKLSLPSLDMPSNATAAGTAETASVPPGGMPSHRRGASMPPNLEDDLSGLPPIRFDDFVSSAERPRLGHRSRGGVFSGDWSSSVAQLNAASAGERPPASSVGGMDEILITSDLPPGVSHRRGGSNPISLTTGSTLGGLDWNGTGGNSEGGFSALLTSASGLASRPQHRRSVTFQGTPSGMSATEAFRMDSLKQSLPGGGVNEGGSPTPPMRTATPPTPTTTASASLLQQQHLNSPIAAAAAAAAAAMPAPPPLMSMPPPGIAMPQPMMNQGFFAPAAHHDLGASSGYADYMQPQQMFSPQTGTGGIDPAMQLQIQMQQALIVQQQQWLLAMQQQQQQQQQQTAAAAAVAVAAAMQQQQQQQQAKLSRTPGAIPTPVLVPQYYASSPSVSGSAQPHSPSLPPNSSHPHSHHHPHGHHHHHHLQQQAAVSPLVRYQPKIGAHVGAGNSSASASSAAAANDTVLAEYKSTGQRPRIEDLKGHVFAFASDAHGSRFLQYQMEIAKPEDKDALVMESLPHAVHLMQDTFGNYVIQNFLEHATVQSRRALAETMKGSMLSLSVQPHGCRVVQRALDLVDIDQRNDLLRELLVPRGNVFQASRNTHATHVLQKTVSILRRDSALEAAGNKKLEGSVELMRAMEKAVADDVVQLLLHPHAYRLVLNVLGDCDVTRSEHVKRAIDVVTENRDLLSVDQHGNFMLQHMLDNKESDRVLDYVRDRVVELSQHKFGSHLVEKCFAVASTERCAELVEEMLRSTTEKNISATKKLLQQNDWSEDLKSAAVLALMKDPYANFVVQKAFDRVQDPVLKDELTNLVQDNAEMLQKFTYGRHILAHVLAAKHAALTGTPMPAPTLSSSPPGGGGGMAPNSPGMRPGGSRGGGGGGYYSGGGGGRGGSRHHHQHGASPNVRG